MHHQRSFNFLYLNKQLQVQINNQGSRTITQEALQILNRVWKHKILSPCIKAFTWRLMRRALATGARAGAYTAKISKECATCNLLENDSHLFFHCTFARAVWFSASPPLITSSLPHEQDGVQDNLTSLITSNTTDDELQIILTTLWYIWKARNDTRFNNKR